MLFDVALRDLLSDPKARTDSRISLLTGIHRKDIRRLRQSEAVIDQTPATVAIGSQVIARHNRSYEREDIIFNPLHYLALLEQKTRALDQAAPLVGWELPDCFAHLRRLLEARLGKNGKREYVQVLRLLETFCMEEVRLAIQDALDLGTVSLDAVKHLLLCRIERRPPRLDLMQYPHLPLTEVHTTQAADYMSLLSEVGQ